MDIETPRLHLREWRAKDLEDYARLLSDPDVTRFMLPMPRQRVEKLSTDFTRQWQQQGFGPFAATLKATGEWVGQIGLARLTDWPDSDNVEVGYELIPRFWGHGLATEGARACLAFGFATLDLGRIISTTNPRNVASRRVMEKAGLVCQGERFYHGHVTVWYSLDHADWRASGGQLAPSSG